MRRDRLRIFSVELGPALPHKDNCVAIAAYAKDALHTDIFLCLKVPEPLVELLDDSFDARRVLILCNFSSALWVFVFDDYAAVFRVNASARQAVFMPPLDGQPRFIDELVDQPIARMAYIFLGPGELCGLHHLLGHDLGVLVNQCFKVLLHGVFRSL